MNTPQVIQVELKNIEEFYSLKNSRGLSIDFGTATGKQLFNHLRHNCTTYDEVLNKIRQSQGRVTHAQCKLVKQSAAEVILAHFRDNHDALQAEVAQVMQEKTTIITAFRQMTSDVRTLLQKLGVDSIEAGIGALDDLLQTVGTTEQADEAYERLAARHKRSTDTFGRLNDTYRVHETLTLAYLEEENIDAQVISNLRTLYKTRSPRTAIPVFCQFSVMEEDAALKRIKKCLYYTEMS